VRPPLDPNSAQPTVLADDEDITVYLRRPEVDANVSAVSAHVGVREALRAAQRAAIHPPGTILAGRDIGTVIVPDAPLKIWLSASTDERARRRAQQLGEPYEEVLPRMVERDRFDGSRAVAPMARAPDAIEINTDGLTPDEVIERIVHLARERMVA
jgi:cytidylate kinase